MKTLRFKVGDLARVVHDQDRVLPWALGEIAEITALDERGPGFKDYCIKMRGHSWYGANDEELEPIPPENFIHADTLKLFDQKPNTDLPVGPKVKERV